MRLDIHSIKIFKKTLSMKINKKNKKNIKTIFIKYYKSDGIDNLSFISFISDKSWDLDILL